jgi:N-acetylmuramoyl-L-alanine amidase
MFIFNTIRLIALTLTLLALTSFALSNKPPKYQIKTIVIDPGHGGHDSGCLGASSKEKHIALAVSLKLGELIERFFPDVRVVFTRKTDVFVELHERAAIANRTKADLFICIHCNAGPSAAYGAETFVMGLHKSDDNLAVARRENESALLEKDYQTNYEGYDPKSPEAHIIFSLYQNAYMEQSLDFASRVQTEFEMGSGRFNRGVKQAGFLVLYRTAMPSVLIELGFLTNAKDEKFLVTPEGQESMANSILKAFRGYKLDAEKKSNGDSKPSLKGEIIDLPPENQSLAKLVEKKLTTIKSDTIGADTSSLVISPLITDSSSQLYFTIQIGAVPPNSNHSASRYKRYKDCFSLTGDDGYNRFFMGRFMALEEALADLKRVKGLGFSDAFVCAIKNGRKISAKEAAEMSKNK